MEEFEKSIKAVNLRRQTSIINQFGDDETLDPAEFSKGHPVGYINKYGKQKQGDGSWKYVGKAAGRAAHAKRKETTGQAKPKTSAATGGDAKAKMLGWMKDNADLIARRSPVYLPHLNSLLSGSGFKGVGNGREGFAIIEESSGTKIMENKRLGAMIAEFKQRAASAAASSSTPDAATTEKPTTATSKKEEKKEEPKKEDIPTTIGEGQHMSPAKIKSAINKFKRQLGTGVDIKSIKVTASTKHDGTYDAETTRISFTTDKGQVAKIFKHRSRFDVDDNKPKDFSSEGKVHMWLPKEGGGTVSSYGYGHSEKRGIEKFKKWSKSKRKEMPSTDKVAAAQTAMEKIMKEKENLDVNSWRHSAKDPAKEYRNGHVDSESGITFGGSGTPSKLFNITLDYQTGTAKLRYGNYINNLSSGFRDNQTEVKIDVTKDPEDLIKKLMKSPKWKGLRANIDRASDADARSYAEYMRRGGSYD